MDAEATVGDSFSSCYGTIYESVDTESRILCLTASPHPITQLCCIVAEPCSAPGEYLSPMP